MTESFKEVAWELGETSRVLRPSQYALECPQLQSDYDACWAGMAKTFDKGRI